MIRDGWETGQEAWKLKTQLRNALFITARAASHPSQPPEDSGQKFPHFPDFSGVVGTQLRDWIAELQMVI
jgi:hypothetical protein